MMATSYRIESAVRGHHIFKRIWTPHIGEELVLRAEHGNTVDRFAVAVMKDTNVVGHVPIEYSRVLWYFLQRRHSIVVCKITGSRRLSEVRGKGLEVPCEYIFKGQTKHVEKLILVFTAKLQE